MGTSESQKIKKSSEYGNFFIQCEKDLYTGGETLRGNAILTILKSYPLSAVNLIIVGQEEIIKNKKEKEIHVSFRREIPLDFVGKAEVMQAGKYKMNFEYQLPPNIPGTLKRVLVDNKYAKIHYAIQIVAKSSDEQIESIMGKTNFLVRQPLLFEKDAKGYAEKQLSSFLCCNAGRCGITILIPKTGVCYNEEDFIIRLGIDNTLCRLDISRFECKLSEIITMQSLKSKDEKHIKTTVLEEWKIPCKAKKGEICDEIIDRHKFKNYYRTHEKGPTIEPETVHGELIKKVYQIFIVPIFDACSVSSRPCFIAEINLSSVSSKQLNSRIITDKCKESIIINMDGM